MASLVLFAIQLAVCAVAAAWQQDMPTGCRIQNYTANTIAASPAVKPDGSAIYVPVTCGSTESVQDIASLLVLDARTGAVQRRVQLDGVLVPTGDSVFTPDGSFVFTAHNTSMSPSVVSIPASMLEMAAPNVAPWNMAPEGFVGDAGDTTYILTPSISTAVMQVNLKHIYFATINDPSLRPSHTVPADSRVTSGTDGAYYAVVLGTYVLIVDPATGYSVSKALLPHGRAVSKIAFGNDNKQMFAVATYDDNPRNGVTVYIYVMRGNQITGVGPLAKPSSSCFPKGWSSWEEKLRVVFAPDDSQVYLLCNNEVVAYDIVSGQQVWLQQLSTDVSTPQFLSSGALVVRSDDGVYSALFVLQSKDGAVSTVPIQGLGPSSLSPYTVSGNTVTACTTSSTRPSQGWCASVTMA